MSIAVLGAVEPTAAASLAASTGHPGASTPQGIFDLGKQLVENANDTANAADMRVRNLALGQTENLHEVMLSLATARVSMGLLVQVRNRAVDAYQDLMRMQI